LLKVFWDQPDLITLDEVVDSELINGLSDLNPDYQISEDSLELIPYVILMTGLFTIKQDDCRDYLMKLRKNTEGLERMRDISTKICYRLFSLYAWDAEFARLMGLDFIEARKRMKSLDSQLFQHYMEKIEVLEGRTLLTTALCYGNERTVYL
jgi:hypothetical protein